MAWFKKTRKPIAATAEKPSRVPEGLWVKCPGCTQIIYNKDLEQNLQVCPKCAHHFRMSAADRLRMLFDGGEWTEHFSNLSSNDPLGFVDTKPYRDRLKKAVESTGLKDAVIVASGATSFAGTATCHVQAGSAAHTDGHRQRHCSRLQREGAAPAREAAKRKSRERSRREQTRAAGIERSLCERGDIAQDQRASGDKEVAGEGVGRAEG